MDRIHQKHISIMDTTLRDGEQTPGVSYTPSEKLHLARLLLTDVKVDRVEVASARVSDGELGGALRVTEWAKDADLIDCVEMLGFCDGKSSVDWISRAGGSCVNLLAKGSEHHCRQQLGITPNEHINRIIQTIEYALENEFKINLYLEDWSNGVRDNFIYVSELLDAVKHLQVNRILLADTLGVLSPRSVSYFIKLMVDKWPDFVFDFHGHNDYGLATANAIAAIEGGVAGIHTSVNGLGERAGNTSLAEIVTAIADHTDYVTKINEGKLASISTIVETFSGKSISENAPILGQDVFTQTAGIHADGDAKGGLYVTRLAPDRFGRERRYALGKLSGKASLDHNLNKLGIKLSEINRNKVLDRIIELGDKKHTVVPEDLLMIIADVLKTPIENLIKIDSYSINVSSDISPEATVVLSYQGSTSKANAIGDGGYDAFMNAVKQAMETYDIQLPRLADYRVRIPPGGRTEALVETLIRWDGFNGEEGFFTVGVDSDQTAAAVIATEKMLNIILHDVKSFKR
ncbi:MAG: 2-isopropylmalate synthase [Rhodospirillaceae bacterium]|nr:2-isopropylmalate synthase [Rhodospirillaceae bacterium]